MALQTTTIKSTKTSNGFTLVLTLTEESTSAANNSSKVSYKLELTSTGYNFSSYSIGHSISLNGSVVSSRTRSNAPQFTLGVNSSIVIASGSVDNIPHDDTGAKSMSVSASIDMAKVSYTPGSMSLSGIMVLTSIGRVSTLSFEPFTIGTSGKITITKQDTNYTNIITYTFGDLTGQINDLTLSTSIDWTPPNDFYGVLSNATSGTGVFTVTTYYGTSGKVIGNKSYSFTVNVASNVVPTINSVSISAVNDNSWIKEKDIYVAGYSKVKVNTTATASIGSKVSSSGYTISGDIGSGSGSSWTSDILSSSGEKSFTVKVTDSRGRSVSSQKTVTFLKYSIPSITGLTYERGKYSNNVWTNDPSGSDLKVTFKLGLSLTDYSNTANLTVTLGNTSIANSSNISSGTKTYYKTGIGTDTSYELKVSAVDSVGKTGKQTITIATIEVPLNINFDLPSIKIGGVATKEKTFESAWNAEFEKDLTINGNLLLNNNPLPLNSGGTGNSTLDTIGTPNAIIKMHSTEERFSHVATDNGAFYALDANGSPRFGTLPIAQGGTGATTLSDARKNLGVIYTATNGAAVLKNANYELTGNNSGCGLVFVYDSSDISKYYISFYVLSYNVNLTLIPVTSNIVTMNHNNSGTLAPSGGSGNYVYNVLVIGNKSIE